MIHPSYSDLMAVVNGDVKPGKQGEIQYLDIAAVANEDAEPGKHSVVQSRYSIVLATAKRARQLISGKAQPLVPGAEGRKPLSIAVDELYQGKVKIKSDED